MANFCSDCAQCNSTQADKRQNGDNDDDGADDINDAVHGITFRLKTDAGRIALNRGSSPTGIHVIPALPCAPCGSALTTQCFPASVDQRSDLRGGEEHLCVKKPGKAPVFLISG
jgi:hypothetical protein